MHFELIVTFFIFSRKAKTLLTCKSSRKREISEASISVGDVDSAGVANLYGLWDWDVGMAPCMGPMSPVRAYSLWAGLCPEKLVKLKLKLKLTIFENENFRGPF